MGQGRGLLKYLNTQISVNTGYIIVPSDLNRSDYIADCFLREQVSFCPESGGLPYHNVKITPEALQNVEFPEDPKSLGSLVLYLVHPIYKCPIIFGVLSKSEECKLLQWKQFRFLKQYKDSDISIIGDAVRSSLQFRVKGGNGQNGQLLLSVIDPENNGLLDIKVQGTIDCLCEIMQLINIDFSMFSSNKVTMENNITTLKTINLSIECVEDRGEDSFSEEIPEESELKKGDCALIAKSLDIKIGKTIVHIEDTDDENDPQPLITINGGELGGLINIQDFTDKLNDLVKEVNDLRQKFNSHSHGGIVLVSGTASGGTVSGTASIPSPSAKGESKESEISNFNKDDYEDTTVTH